MFAIQDQSYRLCDGVTRREWLRVGGLGLLGLSTASLSKAQSAPRPDRNFGKAKACILFFLTGGPPQHETWDPKPDAPADIRGEFAPIATNVPGLQVCELMPRIATHADKTCVLRAVSTGDSAHSSSGYYMMTGVPHQPTNSESFRAGPPNDWPSLGAVYRRVRPAGNHLPAAITLPERIINNPNIPWPGQDGGFLGRNVDPWFLTCDPSSADFQIPELTLQGEIPALRFDERRGLLDQVNRHVDRIDASGAIGRYQHQSQQVFDLLRSPRVRRAFDLRHEPNAMRDRYGRTKLGQSVLLARRLVEAGVPLIQVNWPREAGDTSSGNPLWDTHSQNGARLRNVLMPQLDLSYSALLEDLAQRGLLDETLIVLTGEFGRTPRINAGAGRDHWGFVFSVALAGGGIRGGRVIGASDRIGGHPRDGRVSPPDLTATIFHSLGVDPHHEFRDAFGRPFFVSRGDVLRQAF
ncbi:MAG: DUF1501 domain-containing protein [Gemmataceae bacterium]|nr:DUF1501 domain-containing protein [Gemmataceae bacterium]